MALCLVNGRSEAKPNRELLSIKLEKGTSLRPMGIRVCEAEKPDFQRAVTTQFLRLWYFFGTPI